MQITRLSKAIFLSLLLLVIGSQNSFAGEWRGLKPMHAARKDVTKLFGTCAESESHACTYELDKETVTFQFLGSGCNSKNGFVPVGTLVRIRIVPKFDAILTDYHKFDMDCYSVYSMGPGGERYEECVDDEEGFALRTKSERVTQVYYTASAKDARLCSESYISPSQLFSHEGMIQLELFPTVIVDCPDEINGLDPAASSAKFSGSVSGPKYMKPTFAWTVSAGTITSGQGTYEITVATNGLPRGSTVKATLDVGGISRWRPHSASCICKIK